MNLLTPERRLAAVAEVKEGIAFTLSLPLDVPARPILAPGRERPRLVASSLGPGGGQRYNFRLSTINAMYTDVYCDDAVTLHTQYSTQWDSLAHVGHEFDVQGDGRATPVFYNGYRAHADIVGPAEDGTVHADALGIENFAMAGVQGRGVLVDLRRVAGERRQAFGYELLMRTFDAQKVVVETGDFLCVYTGFADLLMERNEGADPSVLETCAVLDGADAQLLNWITESGLVAICADNLAVEGIPSEPRCDCRHARLPLHEHCLFKLGVHLGELWFFRGLARWLHNQSRNRFLLTAPPLCLPGAVGSPATPIATV